MSCIKWLLCEVSLFKRNWINIGNLNYALNLPKPVHLLLNIGYLMGRISYTAGKKLGLL